MPFFTSRFIRKARPVGLRIAAALTLGALLYTRPLWTVASPLHKSLVNYGSMLLFAGAAGRLWCTLYIAGKKSRQLVTGGPYALCRNPLSLFSFLLGAGVTLIFQHLAVIVFFTGSFPLFHLLAIEQEECRLTGIFGEAYLAYRRQTPRLIPTLRNWRAVFDRQGLTVSPRHLARTLADCAAYLLVIPLARLLELWYGGHFPLN